MTRRRYLTGSHRPFVHAPGDLPPGTRFTALGGYVGRERVAEPDPANCCEVCGGELDDEPRRPWHHDQAASGQAHEYCARAELAYFEMLEGDGDDE